jgi:hypothetical protein
MFARFEFIGVTLLQRPLAEIWQMPVGAFLDQWEIFRQYNGMAKPYKEHYIDEILD